MTNKQIEKKVRSMMGDVRDYLIKETGRLAKSGGIDRDNYFDDYVLPKILLHVALKNCAEQYDLLGDDNKKVAKNLAHF